MNVKQEPPEMKPLLDSARSIIKTYLRKPEKVICVGLGKTGTKSFSEAMRIIGYKPCPVGSVFGLFFAYEHGYVWPISRGLSKYDSFDDFPWPYLYEKISAKYPNAKFVLTRRVSPDSWIESLKRHYCRVGPTYSAKIFYGYYSPYQNLEHHLNLYKNHNERVRSFFRGCPNFVELCWDEGHGWEELCGFLGRKVPDTPFPHVNIAASIDYEKARVEADRRLQSLLK